MDMSTIGIGYCFGGCKVDTDCPTGNKCQKEDGLCVKTPVVYTKTVGTACTDLDAKDPQKCNCVYTTAEKMGYCTQVCRFGESGTCGAGFSCDVGLPKTKLMDDDTVFTAVPACRATASRTARPTRIAPASTLTATRTPAWRVRRPATSVPAAARRTSSARRVRPAWARRLRPSASAADSTEPGA
jgi:hypothetical protein